VRDEKERALHAGARAGGQCCSITAPGGEPPNLRRDFLSVEGICLRWAFVACGAPTPALVDGLHVPPIVQNNVAANRP
jgi:hypothetical protein